MFDVRIGGHIVVYLEGKLVLVQATYWKARPRQPVNYQKFRTALIITIAYQARIN